MQEIYLGSSMSLGIPKTLSMKISILAGEIPYSCAEIAGPAEIILYLAE